MMTKKINNFVNEQTLRTTTIKNIKTVIRLTDLTHAEFAKKTGIAAPTLSSYLSEKEKKIMPVTFLMNVCMMDEVKEQGLNITVNDLISSEFDPAINGKRIQKPIRQDFPGAYYCYYFDQSKSLSERELDTSRDLRFGLLTVFDEYNKLTGEVKYEAYAMFYKTIDREKTEALKESIDEIFNNKKLPSDERNSAIRARFRKESGFYSGNMHFSETHAFISLTCNVFRDRAMMAFYAPDKRSDHKYIGGIGAVTSVTHGIDRMPAAQKIIISAPKLGCSDEVIAEHLSMSSTPIDLKSQGRVLTEICTKLFNANSQIDFLDDSDKTAIITARMNNLVSDYIQKSIFSVGTVSKEEDNKVYNLIKKYL